jgi:hypothetical protein
MASHQLGESLLLSPGGETAEQFGICHRVSLYNSRRLQNPPKNISPL